MNDSAQGPLTIGKLVAARYEVLGAGAPDRLGSVYEAEWDDGGKRQRVELHVLAQPRADAAETSALLEQAHALRRARDPHLLGVLDVVDEEGVPIVVTEHADAPSLEDALRAFGTVRVDVAVDAAVQICRALGAVRGVGVSSGKLGAADVRCAGWTRPELGSEPPERAPFVRVGGFGLGRSSAPGERGEPDAPVASEPTDDVQAIGQLLFQMIAGKPPVPGNGGGPSLGGGRPSLRAEATGVQVPDPLDELVGNLLGGEQDERPTTLPALAAALAAVLTGLRGDASEEQAPATLASDAPAQPAEAASPADGVTTPEPAVGITMKSNRDSALEVAARGAKVEVRISDAPPATPDERGSERAARSGPRRAQLFRDAPAERWAWLVVAIVAAVAALAAGIWLGWR